MDGAYALNLIRPGTASLLEKLAIPVELGLELTSRRYHCDWKMPAVTARGSDVHCRVRGERRVKRAGG
jgi:hypothetical protein